MKYSKEEILKIQKSLYKNLKKRASTYEGHPSKELVSYRLDQKKASTREFTISTSEQLFSKIKKSDIIYLGDLHTLDQNTKNLERILRFLKESTNKFAFGLEFVHKSQQQKIEFYLNGHLTELEFLDSINYEKSWKFPWKHYKTLFDFAKKFKITTLALNSHGSLSQRDQVAAKIIVDFREKNEKNKLLILFGELHIVSDKIPHLVNSLSKSPPQQLIIHQNLDDIFWKIKGLEPSIIKFNENEFSLQVSPPWIKYESMINWWENIINDPEHDIHDYIIEKGTEALSSEAGEKMLFFAQTLNKTLNLEISNYDLENFNILKSNNLNPVLKKIKSLKNTPIELFFKKLLTNGIFFKMPHTFDYYFPNFISNKIAGISGVHIRSIMLNNNYPPLKKSAHFLHYFGNFMASYISVKIFNPYKKCDLYLDIEKKSTLNTIPDSEKKIFAHSKMILDKLDAKELEPDLFKEIDYFGLFFSSRLIGYLFGEVFHLQLETLIPENKKIITDYAFKRILTIEDLNIIHDILFKKNELRDFKKRFF